MKKIHLFVLVLIFIPSLWNKCFNQSKKNVPRILPGVFAGVEWNTLSGLIGIENEIWIWEKNKFTLGIKGIYAFKHQNGNMQLLNVSYDGTSRFWALLPTVHYYTSRYRKDNTGFFLHSGLGIAGRIRDLNEVRYHRTLACFETGFGLQFNLDSSTSLKWTNSVLFAGEGGITLTKLSLCF